MKTLLTKLTHNRTALACLLLAPAGMAAIQGYGQPASPQSPAQPLTAEWQEILSHLSIVYLDDGQGGLAKTIRLEGANLQIVNGAGSTDTVTGVGNLIVGYNEFRSGVNDRTGSHNIVGGKKSNYNAYGGLVTGELNTITGAYGAVVGASSSTALGYAATVTGGHSNRAEGSNSSVGGGSNNLATGLRSVIGGGKNGEASGELAVVAAGIGNDATEYASTVVGGMGNSASGRESAILGGRENETSFRWTSIAGGHWNTTPEAYSSAIGPLTLLD